LLTQAIFGRGNWDPGVIGRNNSLIGTMVRLSRGGPWMTKPSGPKATLVGDAE
jgi:hypothetical protein